MSVMIRELNRHFIDLWWESETILPDLGPVYTDGQKDQNEKQWLELINQAERTLANPASRREEIQSLRLSLSPAVRRLAEETLGFEAGQLDLFPAQAFSEVSEQFVRRARAFDPGLSAEDLYQAGRNAWTANGLQWLLGKPVQMTPAILAYSLLYPYTDNYIDDPAVSVSSKQAFNERFRMRLAGELLELGDPHEKVIFDLVAMIEGQYPRTEYPEVFGSLLAIHNAQTKSLRLLHHSGAPGGVDVLGLSFEKGGTSVLADGYLVSPSINAAQRLYAYGHGIFAQLLDDMEDIPQDNHAGRLTLYSQPDGRIALDALANRTLQFGRKVLMGLNCFEVDGSVRQLIQRAADLFLIDAVGRTDLYYSRSYLRELEAHSPFRFSFLKEKRKVFFSRPESFVKLLESMML
jgi:hypothetical protein